jgi:hypothetical protein
MARIALVPVPAPVSPGRISDRQDNEYRGKTSRRVDYAATGSIGLGSLFLTLPTRGLTGQASIALS